MKRLSPQRGSPQYLEIDPLHRACLLWVDYLRAETEAEKQAFLYEAAAGLAHVVPCGNEGEQIIMQIWRAIWGRELSRVYIKTEGGQNFVEATKDGKFNVFQTLRTKGQIDESVGKIT